MIRLREDDLQRLQELERAILVLRLDRDHGLERTLRDLRHALGVEQTAAWGAVPEDEGFRLVFSFVSGCGPGPPAPGTSRAAGSGDLERVASELRPSLPAGKQELVHLLCSSPQLVAWLGLYQSEPFSRRQEAMVKALAPAFTRRISAERALHAVHSTDAGLCAALDAISRPAFLVDASGTVRQMNHAGRTLAALDSGRVSAELAAATRDRHPAMDVTRIESSGVLSFLVVYRDEPIDPTTRVARAAASWGLTPRQTEVLSRVILGEPNKVIASRLGRAENTIELHITQILKRSGVDNRAALVAKFWTAS